MSRWSALLPALFSLGLSAQVRLDLAPAEAWLQRVKEAPQRPASWEAASAATLGGQRAEAAWSTFGALPDKLPVPPGPVAVQAFLDALRSQDLQSLEKEVGGLFPGLAAPPLQIHVVANGFPAWGDMYVRSFATEGSRQVLASQGDPCILVNALLVIAGYGESPRKQVEGALDVLRHEIFHLFFLARRNRLGLQEPDTPAEALLLTTQNEGIAHLLGSRGQLPGPLPQARVAKAFADLEAVVTALKAGPVEEARLQKADTGPFWEKYAAISGMACARAIEDAQGAEGLRNTLEAGPSDLLLRYEGLCRKDSRRPRLGPETLAWARAHLALK